jgi:hypothetical protein
LSRSFLVRNWCGGHLVVELNELQPYPNARRKVKGAHAEDAAPSGASQIYGVAGQPTMTVLHYFQRRAASGGYCCKSLFGATNEISQDH